MSAPSSENPMIYANDPTFKILPKHFISNTFQPANVSVSGWSCYMLPAKLSWLHEAGVMRDC